PGCRHRPLRQPQRALPRGLAALSAPVLDGLPGAAREGGSPRGFWEGKDQGPDRVGVAGPSWERGPAAWRPGNRRRALRGLADAPRRFGPAGAVLHRGRHLGDGGLHRATPVGATRAIAGWPTADFAPVGRGEPATDHPRGTGPAFAPPESHLA